jgi:hypothetical protein
MDISMGGDLYDSFVHYQTRMIGELDRMAAQYGFDTLDATRPIDDVCDYLNERVTALLSGGDGAHQQASEG